MALPTRSDVSLVDPVLSNMVVAYMNSDDRFVASRVFPPVSVENDTGTYAIFTKKYWFLDGLQRRAPGSSFGRANIGVSSGTYDVDIWGLEKQIEDEVEAANQVPMSLEDASLQWLAHQSLIRKEKQFSSDFMITGVWGTSNSTATDWDDFAGSDPVNDVRTAKRTISQNTGKTPNTMVCGEIVEDALLNHPDLLDRIKYVGEATEANIRGALAAIFGLEQVLVSMATENTANEGQSFSASAIIDDDALVCFVDPGANVMTATAGKTFYWPGGGGLGEITPYREQQTKSDILQHQEAWDQVAVATDLGYIFLNIV